MLKLDHPLVVRIISVYKGFYDSPSIVLELCDGILEDLIRERRKVNSSSSEEIWEGSP
jgi:hypothetical protein